MGRFFFARCVRIASALFQNEINFVLSPHIGGVTNDAYVNMGVAAARNALAVLGSQLFDAAPASGQRL